MSGLNVNDSVLRWWWIIAVGFNCFDFKSLRIFFRLSNESTLNATWFIEPCALRIDFANVIGSGLDIPGTDFGAFVNQKYPKSELLPISKNNNNEK